MKLAGAIFRISLLFMLSGIAGLTVSTTSHAHDGRPIVINITEQEGLRVSTTLQVPDAIEPRFRPQLKLPNSCKIEEERLISSHLKSAGDGYQYLIEYTCTETIRGQRVQIDFPAFNPSLTILFEVQYDDGERFSKVIMPGTTSWVIPEGSNLMSVMKDYTWLGMTHIWKGWDHLLFIICLLFFAKTYKRIIAAITGFTIAHSFTLALSALGFVTVSLGAIEALIALSIVVLAAEIIRRQQNTYMWRYPILLASGFGLLHGLGFASVLESIGLPQLHKLQALIFFNIGVEIGQIIFIAIVMLFAKGTLRLLKADKNKNIFVIARMASLYSIGLISAFWFIQRSSGVLFS